MLCSVAKFSAIAKAGLERETLRRAGRGDSAAKVHRWLEGRGVKISLSSVKAFVCHRHGGTWKPRPGCAPVVTSMVQVVHRLPSISTIDEIREVALDRVRSGESTVADARLLDIALKAAIAESLTSGVDG